MITTFAASHPLQSSQSLPFLLIEKRGRTFMWSQQYLVGILLILVQPTLILLFESSFMISSKNPVSHHIRERGISAGCCLFSAAKEEQHIRFISILQRSSAAVKPDFRKGKCFASMLLHQGVAAFVLITIFHLSNVRQHASSLHLGCNVKMPPFTPTHRAICPKRVSSFPAPVISQKRLLFQNSKIPSTVVFGIPRGNSRR